MVKAGELLAPNFFTDALRKHDIKETNARDYGQQKSQFKEFMATTGNDNDKERYMRGTSLLVHYYGCVHIKSYHSTMGVIPDTVEPILCQNAVLP